MEIAVVFPVVRRYSMFRQSGNHFGDKNMLQYLDLARALVGEAIPLRRGTRWSR